MFHHWIDVYQHVPERAGVYLIRFAGSKFAYVGSSKNMRQRVRAHLSEMTSYWHKMNHELKENGPDAIEIDVLAEVPNLNDLPAVESRWIQIMSNEFSLYNVETRGKYHRDRMEAR